MLPFSHPLIVLTISLLLSTYYKSFVQYLKDSLDQIIQFFESNTAVSQTVALETAAAVQVWFYLCWSFEVLFRVAIEYLPSFLELCVVIVEIYELFIVGYCSGSWN